MPPASPSDLQTLKQPFGTLVPSREVTKRKVLQLVKGALKIIAVGDATTEKLVSFGIVPDLAVIDGRERRSKRTSIPDNYEAIQLVCSNPPGGVSVEALETLRVAINMDERVRVMVNGEEDMLALPIFSMVPDGTVVLYGQPLEGLVVTIVNEKARIRAKRLMDRIGVN
jgi:uncharacterized protein (UPF0218 family)